MKISIGKLEIEIVIRSTDWFHKYTRGPNGQAVQTEMPAFHASIVSLPGCWGRGSSFAHALGDLIQTHPQVFAAA